jgi:hypothetical protein
MSGFESFVSRDGIATDPEAILCQGLNHQTLKPVPIATTAASQSCGQSRCAS